MHQQCYTSTYASTVLYINICINNTSDHASPVQDRVKNWPLITGIHHQYSSGQALDNRGHSGHLTPSLTPHTGHCHWPAITACVMSGVSDQWSSKHDYPANKMVRSTWAVIARWGDTFDTQWVTFHTNGQIRDLNRAKMNWNLIWKSTRFFCETKWTEI